MKAKRLLQLAATVLVGGFTQFTHAAPVLSVDINDRDTAVTMAGFDPFVIGAVGSSTVVQTNATVRTIGAFTVTLSGTGTNPGYDDRLRSTPVNSGAFTDSLLLRDFVFSRSAGLDLLIEGLVPDEFYEVTLWSFDPLSTGNRVADWSVNGFRVKENYAFNGAVLPVDNDQYRFSFKVGASATGSLLIEGRTDGSSSNPLGTFLNAFQLEPTVPDAPAFTSNPQDAEVYEGELALFTGEATGTVPIGYQWLKDGVAIADATDPSLVVSNAVAGSYALVAANASGSVTSLVANLTVLPVADIQTALVAYWPLDEIITTFTPDLSGNGQDLTLNNMDASNLVPGQLNLAMQFDGTGEILTRNNTGNGLPAYANGSYSVAMWVNGTGFGQNDRRVFSEGSGASDTPLVNIGTHRQGLNGAVDIYIRNSDGSAVVNHRFSTAEPFDGTWHHIAWVDDNGFARLYVDGVEDATDFTYARGQMNLDTISVGAILRAGPCCWFAGSIDDVAVWGRAITPGEVMTAMNGGLQLPFAITSIESTGRNVALKVRTPELAFYIIEETSSLTNPVWTEVLGVVEEGLGTAELTATFPAPAGTRFYRVRLEPL